MKEKTICIILAVWVINIVAFVANNNTNFQHVWNLGYYSTYYMIVFIAITLGWNKYKSILAHTLFTVVGFYYAFHLIINFIEIFDPELKKQLYTGKSINYILALGCAWTPVIYPLIIKSKKYLNKLLTKLIKYISWGN